MKSYVSGSCISRVKKTRWMESKEQESERDQERKSWSLGKNEGTRGASHFNHLFFPRSATVTFSRIYLPVYSLCCIKLKGQYSGVPAKRSMKKKE